MNSTRMGSRLCHHPDIFHASPAYGGNHLHDKSVIQRLVSLQINPSILVPIKIFLYISSEDQHIHHLVLFPENLFVALKRHRWNIFNRNGFGGLFRKLTSRPCCINGAVIMNITNKTNMTSTNGVTLISAIIGRLLLNIGHLILKTGFSYQRSSQIHVMNLKRGCIFGKILFYQINKVVREIVQIAGKHSDLITQVVIKNNCRYRRDQSCRRGD